VAEHGSLRCAPWRRNKIWNAVPAAGANRSDARLRRIEARGDGIRDRHVMTGKREYLRNAMTHQTGTDDGNA